MKEIRNFTTSSGGSSCVWIGAGKDVVVFISGPTKQGLRIQPASSKKPWRAAPRPSHQEDWNTATAFMDTGMRSFMSAAALLVPVDYGADRGWDLSLSWALHPTEVIFPGICLCVESNPPANLKQKNVANNQTNPFKETGGQEEGITAIRITEKGRKVWLRSEKDFWDEYLLCLVVKYLAACMHLLPWVKR